MVRKLHKYSLLLIISVGYLNGFSALFIKGGEGDKCSTHKDTARATVIYGDKFLTENDKSLPSKDQIDCILDSLLHYENIDYKKIDEWYFYRNINEDFSESELSLLIDSLFDLDTIPFALINQIDRYATYLSNNKTASFFYKAEVSENSPYPAHSFYSSWNCKYPFNYSQELSEYDTVVHLQLTDASINCGFHYPVGEKTIYRYHGTVTSKFGWRDNKNHNGVDVELHKWDSVYSVFPGMVRLARNYKGFGNVVIVRHYNGLETLYAHLSVIKVKSGELVEAGQTVGLGGSSGNATGTHLHFEMRFKGVPIDPQQFIDFKNRTLYSSSIELRKYRHGYVVREEGQLYYTVKKGDYPYKVAKRYGLTLKKLCEINDITTKTKLIVGEKIKIKS